MDLSYTPEQEMFRTSVREFVEDRLPPDRLAEIADGEEGWDPALWKEAATLGLAGVSVPEDLGGAGMGFIEEAIVAEELGRALFPGPWLGTAVLSRAPLAETGELLASVAAGERVVTVAGLGAPLAADGASVSGRARYVVDLGPADLLVVPAVGEAGVSLFTVEKDRGDWRTLRTVDGTRRLGEVTFEQATAKLLAEPEAVDAALERTRIRALAALASEAVGVASRAVDLAVEHARTREQFGKPVGSFQAVSHQIADAFMDAENARSLAVWAALALDAGEPDAEVAARTAHRFAAESAVRACERAIQVHGGIGFTWEHPLHRYYKRALWIASVPPAWFPGTAGGPPERSPAGL